MYKAKYTKEAIEKNPELEEQGKKEIAEYGQEEITIEVDEFVLTPGMQALLTVWDLQALEDIIIIEWNKEEEPQS